jgi:hypothetical protein
VEIITYRSDDYAGLKIGKLEFYAGYEYRYIADLPENEEDDGGDWGFVVSRRTKKGMRTLMVMTEYELVKYNKDLYMDGDVVDYLLTGIGVFLKTRKIRK